VSKPRYRSEKDHEVDFCGYNKRQSHAKGKTMQNVQQKGGGGE